MRKRDFFVGMVVSLVLATTALAVEYQVVDGKSAQMCLENDDFRIVVNVCSNVYNYELTNLSSSRIVSFEMDIPTYFFFSASDGWQVEKVGGGTFRARTDDFLISAEPGKTIEFKVIASRIGPVLCCVPVRVEFQSGKSSVLQGVWAPVAEPKGNVVIIAGALVFIVLLHTAIVTRRSRKKGRKTSVNDV